MRSLGTWRLFLSMAVLLASIYLLYPSYEYHMVFTDAQRRSTADPKINAVRERAIRLGLDLQGGIQLLMEVDQTKLGKAEASDAVDRAIEVIRNRVDQFGVSEPLIQKEAGNRIAVQLPGMNDPERAKSLIGQTALLEFKLVRSGPETAQILQRADDWLKRHQPAAAPGVAVDSLGQNKPLTSLIQGSEKGGAFFLENDLKRVYPMADALRADSVALPGDTELLWGEENDSDGQRTGRWLYAVKREPELTGGIISSAIARVGLDPALPGSWGVSMSMTPAGRNEFAAATGRNVNRQLAIVLDGKVRSAPTIHERIRGDASITGNFNDKSARDLAIVLKAGALPAPVRILEERTVGPTLGSDSIHKGFMAGLVGAALVALFMIIYYQFSGVIAVVAMGLNVVFLLAAMPLLKSTLTLPGIAGIVLTIGVAVDANVLIFERIREELRAKKTVAAAVTAGYNRAWLTILDAHITAFISALFLYMFGTGAIRGFAVTFSVGLLANLFTAVFMTRFVFDWMTSRKRLTNLSI